MVWVGAIGIASQKKREDCIKDTCRRRTESAIKRTHARWDTARNRKIEREREREREKVHGKEGTTRERVECKQVTRCI